MHTFPPAPGRPAASPRQCGPLFPPVLVTAMGARRRWFPGQVETLTVCGRKKSRLSGHGTLLFRGIGIPAVFADEHFCTEMFVLWGIRPGMGG